MTDKPMLNGLTEAETLATASVAGLSMREVLPIVAWQDGDFVQSERPVDLCSGDASAWIPLTPHAPAQAIIERLEAKLKEQALQYLSDNGQWIEETDRLRAELSALKAKQVADVDEVMRLVGTYADRFHRFSLRPTAEGNYDMNAAREALRSALAARGMEARSQSSDPYGY